MAVSDPHRLSQVLSIRLRAGIVAFWLGMSGNIVSGSADGIQIDNPTLAERLEDYLRLRHEAVREVGRVQETDEPSELREDVLELMKQIQTRRQGAREGDILGRPVEQTVRSSLRQRLSRPDGPRIVADILDVQPEVRSPIVNTRYPGSEPRSTMPPQVLRVLPRLPTELSFRFVGRDLVLLDRNTGLILDVLRNALPRD